MTFELPRLFILGAGFSQPAGMPLAGDLLGEVLDAVTDLRPETHLHRSLEDYLRYTEATTGMRPDPVDIELFAAYLDHQHAFGLLGSDTWSSQGNRDQLLLRRGIGRVLHRAAPDPSAIPELYYEFGRRLRPSDFVLTFNYDLLLEQVLEELGRRFRRFPNRFTEVGVVGGTIDSESEAHDIRIIKPHGSIDWVDRWPYEDQMQYMRSLQGEDGAAFTKRRDLVFGDSSITGTRPLLEGPQLPRDRLKLVEVVENLDGYYSSSQVAYFHPPWSWHRRRRSSYMESDFAGSGRAWRASGSAGADCRSSATRCQPPTLTPSK